MTTERIFEIKTVLGDGALLVHRFRAWQELGRLSEIELELLSQRNDLDFNQLLGTSATVSLEVLPERLRHFNGLVARFAATGFTVGRYHQYRASIRTWNWLLTRSADCRIFQNQSVPEILKQVFQKYPDVHFEEKLSAKYAPREYCVQYRETDFNFVSRLMEQEGIYYYVQHSDGKHVVVLADSPTAHQPAQDFNEVAFITGDRTEKKGAPAVVTWECARELQPGRYVLSDFDFTKPKADLGSSTSLKRQHALAEFEMFDYPGEFFDPDLGRSYAKRRIEELHSRHELVQAKSTARGLCPGSTFKLTGHSRRDQNREYVVVAEEVVGENNLFDTGDSGGAWCECNHTFLHQKEVFRPARNTRAPFVQGPQTAMVVGPAGEEIWTDKYGRVKVQFHWDRYGKRDENSSCWIRVSHPWAGKGWGSVSIPRIGQEVIVDFLEGDPDRPIITGRVYNADSMPPFQLPGDAVVSGIKSATHKGKGFNEISMNDTAGKEGMNLHAQYDQTVTVNHDQTSTVKNNRATTVVVDDSLNVNANRTVNVKGKLSEKVDTGQEVTVASGYKETITGGANSTISGGLTSTVNGEWTSTVNGLLKEKVTGGEDQTVSSGKKLTVTGGFIETVTGDRTMNVTGPIKIDASAKMDLHAGGAATYDSGTSLKLFVSGSAVEITPSAITISAAGSTVKIDAAGVSLNGAKISLNG